MRRQEFPLTGINDPCCRLQNYRLICGEMLSVEGFCLPVGVQTDIIRQRDAGGRNVELDERCALLDAIAAGGRERFGAIGFQNILESAQRDAGQIEHSAKPAGDKRAVDAHAFDAFVELAAQVVCVLPEHGFGQVVVLTVALVKRRKTAQRKQKMQRIRMITVVVGFIGQPLQIPSEIGVGAAHEFVCHCGQARFQRRIPGNTAVSGGQIGARVGREVQPLKQHPGKFGVMVHGFLLCNVVLMQLL